MQLACVHPPGRPVGFRVDGNGYFPGETSVTERGGGTVGSEKKGNVELPVLTDRKAKNVVWKAEMPSWANSQPTVVGGLVFTTAEPNLLVCVDAHTGKLRWTAAANPWELLGVEAKQAEKAQALYDVWREVVPVFNAMWGSGTMTRKLPHAEFAPIAEVFVDKVLPRVVKALAEIDPDGRWEQAGKTTGEAVMGYARALAASDKPGYDGPPPVEKHDPLKGRMTKLADELARRIVALGGFVGTGRTPPPKVPLTVPWGASWGSPLPPP